MDEVDLIIFKELWDNSRVTIRELSDKTGISVNSVHKRINNLVELGVIEKFFMLPIKLLPASVWVLIIGKSGSTELEKAILRLGGKGNVFKTTSCLDNHVMVTGYLKDISDIKDFTEDVVRGLALEEYTFGIHSIDVVGDGSVSFSKLDYRILDSMADDSRKAISDVAKELGVSPKTVKRRLVKMEEDGAVHIRPQWQPTMSDIILSYMYLTLGRGVTKQEVIAHLANDYKPHHLNHYEFTNLPDFLLTTFWGNTLHEINDIQQRLEESGKFKIVVANVQYKSYHFDTWAREYVRKMAREM